MAREQVAERETTDRNPLELVNLMSMGSEHSPNFPVFPLVECHLEHGALFVLRSHIDPLGMHLALGEMNAPADGIERFPCGNAGDLDKVPLLDAIAGMSKKVGQRAVIGDEEQSLAHAIESAHGEEPLLAGYEIDHPGTSGGIVVGGDDSDGFVEQIDHPSRPGQPFAIHANVLSLGINPCSQRVDDGSIHLDTAGGNQLLAGSTAPQAGGGKNFLQSLELLRRGGRSG